MAANSMEEDLFITDIPCKVGKYPIEYSLSLLNNRNQIPEALFAFTHEQDEPFGSFLVDTLRQDHFVEVLRYNKADSTVEGRFQVFLGKDPLGTNFSFIPDSIFLTEGKFYLKIK